MTHAQIRAAATDSKPYGDVTYADPGYQDDGKKRYPLDSEAHCRAAWSYINQSGNASKYTTEQLAAIKAKIRAAGKKYDINFVDGPQRTEAAAELLGVELARPGTWQLSSGEFVCTPRMLQDAARYAARKGARPAPLKLGHVDARFDGEPALGWVGNLRVGDDDGPVLLGDITGMPDWLAAAMPNHWPDRSVEGWTDFVADGETFSFVLDGLALLGVTPPGISSIRSLRDLPKALGIAAAARIVARAPGDTHAATSATPETSRPATAQVDKPATGRGSTVDPAEFRGALGLQPTASKEEVQTALVAAGLIDAPPEPVAAAEGTTRGADAPGVIRVDASAWQEREERLARLEAAEARHRQDERDTVITEAVKAGKFAPSRRQHWVRLWDADPDGTREVIAGLAKDLIGTTEVGYSAESDEEIDREFGHLFGPVAQKGGRRG